MERTSMCDLPADLVAQEILTRVPITSLPAVRSTCKLWNSLSKYWILGKAAAARQHQFLGFMTKNSKVCSVRFNLCSRNSKDKVDEDKDLIDLSVKQVDLLNKVEISRVFQCNGLVLYVAKDNSRLLMWKPYLGETQWIRFPTGQVPPPSPILHATEHPFGGLSMMPIQAITPQLKPFTLATILTRQPCGCFPRRRRGFATSVGPISESLSLESLYSKGLPSSSWMSEASCSGLKLLGFVLNEKSIFCFINGSSFCSASLPSLVKSDLPGTCGGLVSQTPLHVPVIVMCYGQPLSRKVVSAFAGKVLVNLSCPLKSLTENGNGVICSCGIIRALWSLSKALEINFRFYEQM